MRVNGREIVETGVIVTQTGDETVEISYKDLKFTLVFIDDRQKLRVVGDGEGKNLTLQLGGFDNPLGSAWSAEVGTTNSKKLILSLYTHAIGEGSSIVRLINFTFSTVEA